MSKSKRDELAVLWCRDYQFDSSKDRGSAFKAGYDASFTEAQEQAKVLIELLEKECICFTMSETFKCKFCEALGQYKNTLE